MLVQKDPSGVTGTVNGCKGLAMWTDLQEGGPSDKFKDLGKRVIPVTRNPVSAWIDPWLDSVSVTDKIEN